MEAPGQVVTRPSHLLFNPVYPYCGKRKLNSYCAAAADGRIYSGLAVKAADDQRDILTAKAKAIGEHMLDTGFTGLVGNVVEIAVRILDFVVDRRWEDAPADGHDTGDQFHRAGGGDQVAEHALAAGDRDLVSPFPENLFDGDRLAPIVDLRAGAVGVDVANVFGFQPGVLQRRVDGNYLVH